MTEEQLSHLQGSQKNIGNQGEDFVLSFERQRLARLIGADRLSNIAIVGREDVGLGYDIASFEGAAFSARDRFIEVKTFVGTPHFFLSQSEWAALDTPALDIMSILRTYNDKVTRTSGTPIFIPGRALKGFLLDATEQRMKGSPVIKRVFTNEGKPWTANQSQRLEVLVSMHQDIATIAHDLKRTPAEIHAQLRLLGLEP